MKTAEVPTSTKDLSKSPGQDKTKTKQQYRLNYKKTVQNNKDMVAGALLHFKEMWADTYKIVKEARFNIITKTYLKNKSLYEAAFAELSSSKKTFIVLKDFIVFDRDIDKRTCLDEAYEYGTLLTADKGFSDITQQDALRHQYPKPSMGWFAVVRNKKGIEIHPTLISNIKIILEKLYKDYIISSTYLTSDKDGLEQNIHLDFDPYKVIAVEKPSFAAIYSIDSTPIAKTSS